MKNQHGYFDPVIIIIVAGIIGVAILVGAISTVVDAKQRPALYAAYCKVQDCSNLSIEEFAILKREGLLPGQQVKSGLSTGEAAAIGMAAGAAAAGARR